METKLIIEKGRKGQMGIGLPPMDVPEKSIATLIPTELIRDKAPALPEVSEPELVRHYINLSTKNHHVDKNLYPLGSCTMKYNPKINDWTAAHLMLATAHPHQPEIASQQQLRLYYELEQMLCNITGMNRFTLQPAAGSQGELVGVMVMRKYHELKGNHKTTILIPDAAHGTNPASVAMAGYNVVEVKSSSNGLVDIDDFKSKINDEVAGFMLTNPNTLGLFEDNLSILADLIHGVDGLMYMDGANMNALLGLVKPAELGFDITHINLHKTFSTPHGGGGPGAGPIGVVEKLANYLPIPRIDKVNDAYTLNVDLPHSIGRLSAFYGNFGVLVRAWTYIRTLGAEGLVDTSKNAIINANYLMAKLTTRYDIGYEHACMHEFVLSAQKEKEKGIKALDIAKRLLDYGYHSPTMYFPLIVKEALMIEPTENETKETLDDFIDVMFKILDEIDDNPEIVKNAPYTTPIRRVDETVANRQLNTHWNVNEF